MYAFLSLESTTSNFDHWSISIISIIKIFKNSAVVLLSAQRINDNVSDEHDYKQNIVLLCNKTKGVVDTADKLGKNAIPTTKKGQLVVSGNFFPHIDYCGYSFLEIMVLCKF